MGGIGVSGRIIDVLVSGAIGQVVVKVVRDGLVLANLQVDRGAEIDTVRLGNLA